MITRNESEKPERIGRLSDAVSARAITPRVLQGYESLSFALLKEHVEDSADPGARWEAGPVRELLNEAMRRFSGEAPTRSDAWLAPRLHYTLRLTRSEASETSLWNFLGLCLAPDFVQWRWGRGDGRRQVGQAARFTGRWDLQCFSRLWWAAELFRDGKNYGPVELACGNQDVLNTVLRQEMIQHRPAAQAFLRLQFRDVIRTGRDVNAAAAIANAAAATLVYEVLAPDELQDADVLHDWVQAAADGPAVQYDTLPQGPNDGCVPHGSSEILMAWFEKLFADAPVRGRPRSADEEETSDDRHGSGG
ncbi:DUF6339 family protein [Streptomyces poriferorum]|uniref:DUF6339 family protein n=1 Tax=Streptomyces TaxID=1883 RepID=UPI00273D3933|nr:DUF6339 family protein [Streptomyces sp. Alt1]WLQ48517.1 DUF6339 family protein [Streptomyces sp. Alt1]